MEQTVKVHVVRDILPDGTALSELKECPATPQLRRLCRTAREGLKLYPQNVLVEAYGLGRKGIGNWIRSRRRQFPAGAGVLLKGEDGCWRQHYTEDQKRAIEEKAAILRRLREEYAPLKQAAKALGTRQPQTLMEWLKAFPAEKREGWYSVKDVRGAEVVCLKKNNVEHYIPRSIVEDGERLRQWADSVYWEHLRLRLPEKYKGYVFMTELERELDIKHGTVHKWLLTQVHSPQFEEGDYVVRTKRGILHPKLAAIVRDRFRKNRTLGEEYVSAKELGKAIGAGSLSVRNWIRRNMSEYDGMKSFYGVPVEEFEGYLYLKRTLEPAETQALRSAIRWERSKRLSELLTSHTKREIDVLAADGEAVWGKHGGKGKIKVSVPFDGRALEHAGDPPCFYTLERLSKDAIMRKDETDDCLKRGMIPHPYKVKTTPKSEAVILIPAEAAKKFIKDYDRWGRGEWMP